METVYIVLIILLAVSLAAALICLFSLRSSLKEAARELEEKLGTDTNTLISISSGDREVRDLAAQINRQLRSLRDERLRLRNGDIELKNAVTNISHDLRTPLTAVCGYLELLERETLPERPARYIAVIRERTDAMRELTEELFRYSMVIGDTDALSAGRVSLGDILEESLAGFYGVLSGRGIEPVIGMPERPVVRTLDSNALRRIYDNILSNAAKYSDGDLTVCLTSDGTVIFENSAGGLDPVRTARLCDRFYTVNTVSGGTGLGLSIAKRLAERMNGNITAEYTNGRLRISVLFPEQV